MLVFLNLKYLKILIFDICSKFCINVVRGLEYLVKAKLVNM